MPQNIQRVPRGLNELLSLAGGKTPTQLGDLVMPTLELLQFYGLSQLQCTIGSNAAAAEGAGASPALPASQWFVLFGASANITKTATATALRGDITLNRRTDQALLLFTSGDLGPFGATETGSVSWGGRLPYPVICPPGSTIAGLVRVLGTDANCVINVFAEFAVVA